MKQHSLSDVKKIVAAYYQAKKEDEISIARLDLEDELFHISKKHYFFEYGDFLNNISLVFTDPVVSERLPKEWHGGAFAKMMKNLLDLFLLLDAETGIKDLMKCREILNCKTQNELDSIADKLGIDIQKLLDKQNVMVLANEN